MPSLHFGWAVLVAWAVVRFGRTRWRWLSLAHPVLTLLAIIVTANHYWMDAFVALLIFVGCAAGVAWRTDVKESRRAAAANAAAPAHIADRPALARESRGDRRPALALDSRGDGRPALAIETRGESRPIDVGREWSAARVRQPRH
jgi:hypothetical protein